MKLDKTVQNFILITIYKNITVDEVGVDEMGLGEMGVDEMGSRRSGNKPIESDPTPKNL